MILQLPAFSIINYRRMIRKIKTYLLKSAFKSYGRNFKFDPNGYYTYDKIRVGNDVYIGPMPYISASESSVSIGNKVIIGPNSVFLTGDHNYTKLGMFMYDVKEKLPENDQPIVIDDDVWIGANVVILKGVHIGRGSIIAAGAIVINDVLPYTIVGGFPAKKIKNRWSKEKIIEHEKMLYEK